MIGGATEKLRKVRQRCGEVWRYAVVTGGAEYNSAPEFVMHFSDYWLRPNHRKFRSISFNSSSCGLIIQ